MMIQHIKSAPTTGLSKATLLVFATVLVTIPNARSQTNQVDGINDAFSSAVEQRDPFWPVGFEPERIEENAKSKKEKTTGNVDWNKAMKQISIRGVSSRAGNEFYAIINGQIKTVGETVSVTVANVLYTWAIDSIAPPSSVKLLRISAQ